MRPLVLDEIVGVGAYEALRDDYRARLIAHKRPRRLAVGDRVTLIFENRETIRFQVQEMIRVEGIREPDKVQMELDVYNELVPGDGELSATLMIEITDLAEIRPELDRLIGLDEHVSLRLAGREPIPARFDAKQLEEDRIAAVQYIKWRLQPDEVEAFCKVEIAAEIAIDQENYRVSAEIPRDTRHSLIEDLRGGIAPLLRVPEGGGVTAGQEGVIEELDGIRVRHPHQAAGPGHVVIEAAGSHADWLAVGAERWAALQSLLQRYGGEIQARYGACRCVTDLGAGARFHLFAPR